MFQNLVIWSPPSAPSIPGSTFKKLDLDQNPIIFCFPLRHDMRCFVAVDSWIWAIQFGTAHWTRGSVDGSGIRMVDWLDLELHLPQEFWLSRISSNPGSHPEAFWCKGVSVPGKELWFPPIPPTFPNTWPLLCRKGGKRPLNHGLWTSRSTRALSGVFSWD